MSHPFVSVVVLNYNGLRFLEDCLGSLSRLDYPRDRYEVVMVDNVSSDGSAEEAEKRFPGVRVVRNDRNLGFAGGNNVAMRGSRADYVVLLNNDTSVHPQWLTRLVEAAEQDPMAGACTCKLLFSHNRARVDLAATPFVPGDWGSPDGRELGVQVLDAYVSQGAGSRRAECLRGFYGTEPSPQGAFRWTAADATLGLPVQPGGGDAVLHLVVAATRPDDSPATLTLKSAEAPLGEWTLDGRPRRLEVPLPRELTDAATPVIQNAGTRILPDGSGRDRGTVVRGTEVYSEDDRGQYDRREEVFAGCGAALLLRKQMLEDVGLFDEDFFMYYEDMDLSWRARRRGWKVLYVPDAVVRHVHAASSVEWSPFFIYHVERNRLLMLAKNAPLRLAVTEQLRYAAATALNLGRYARSVALHASDRPSVGGRVRIQIKVLLYLLGRLPSTAAKRRELGRKSVVPAQKLLRWMESA